MHLPPKMSSLCVAPRKQSFVFAPRPGAPLRYQVGYFTVTGCKPDLDDASLFSGHTSPILCASFSPTGNLLATGSGDCNARLWDLFTETPSHVLSGHKGWVLCVEWEAMERKLATGGHDGHVRLWDPKTGKAIGDALKGHSKWVTSLAWEPIHLYASSS